ncbi:MAG TPA: hypothetical protein VMF89_00005 [Polyangiales bacterium]|nr:hypothetical protein [Polyangiales bacterium]
MSQTRVLSETDAQQLDAVLRAFYEVISFDDGATPDWERMSGLFSAHARITRVTPEAIDYMDLSTFRSMAEELLEVGAYTSFYEREIARRADRFGNVLHVASAYETKISPNAQDFIERGVNSLQLIREDGRWRIISLCWDDHALFNAEGMMPVSNKEARHGQS